MGRRTTIAVFQDAGDWADRLRDEFYDVQPADAGPDTGASDGGTDAGPNPGPRAGPIAGNADVSEGRSGNAGVAAGAQRPDLVLIATVRACRTRWPSPTTPVLVLGVGDPELGSAAIEAGATDAVLDAEHGPMMRAHIRRLLRSKVVMRELLAEERRRAKHESLTIAAADVAVPLGELLDKLEAAMVSTPGDERFNELLELTARAVDAVDRLRDLAASADSSSGTHDGH